MTVFLNSGCGGEKPLAVQSKGNLVNWTVVFKYELYSVNHKLDYKKALQSWRHRHDWSNQVIKYLCSLFQSFVSFDFWTGVVVLTERFKTMFTSTVCSSNKSTAHHWPKFGCWIYTSCGQFSSYRRIPIRIFPWFCYFNAPSIWLCEPQIYTTRIWCKT